MNKLLYLLLLHSSFSFSQAMWVPVSRLPDSSGHFVSWTNPSGDFWSMNWSSSSMAERLSGTMRHYLSVDGSLQPSPKGGATEFVDGQIPPLRTEAMTWTGSDGRLWLFGGQTGYGSVYFNDFWVYTTTWKQINTKDTPQIRAASAMWQDKEGNLYLFGGKNSQKYFNDLWKFDIKSNEWKELKATAKRPYPRAHAAVWALNDRVYLYGGYGTDSTLSITGGLSDLWEYDIESQTWAGSNTAVDRESYPFILRKGEKQHPGFRISPYTWIDQQGNLCLFSGHYSLSDQLVYTDQFIWKYDTALRVWSIDDTQNRINLLGGGAVLKDASGNVMLLGGQQFMQGTTRPVSDIYQLKQGK